jgi:hypothetical protein
MAYPQTQLTDNIDLEIAIATDSVERRIALLSELLAAFPHGDAVPEAMYRLGSALRDHGDRERSRRVFDELSTHSPDSPWAKLWLDASPQFADAWHGRAGS